VENVLCSICKSVFNTAWRSFRYAAAYQENKTPIAAETESCSKKVKSRFTKETITDECKHIAAEEGPFALHTIKHNHSFDSWIVHPQ
jgi:hypothetical protein